MKNREFRNVVVILLCILGVKYYQLFSAGPFEFRPNWFVIAPLAAFITALVCIPIRNQRTAEEMRERKADAEVAAAYANAVDHIGATHEV
jgi:hypothetical protein